jgi:hypothetical protein
MASVFAEVTEPMRNAALRSEVPHFEAPVQCHLKELNLEMGIAGEI